MAEKSRRSLQRGLEKLQARMGGSAASRKPEPESLLLAYLARNLKSQKILAEWQETLRAEQEFLISQMLDQKSLAQVPIP